MISVPNELVVYPKKKRPMGEERSLYDVVEKELLGIKGLVKYLQIFERDIISCYPIFSPLPERKDYLYRKARDYFFFAVIPSIEIIKNEELKKKHEKHLLRVQTLLALSERFLNNVVDGHSRYIQDDLIFYAYVIHEAINLLSNELSVIGIPLHDLFKKFKEIAQSAYFKIPNKNKSSTNKTDIKIWENANHLWKRAGSMFIIPLLLETTPHGLKALENYMSANILIDDLLDLFDDYKHNRETLPLVLWKIYSQEMVFNKWASDFVIKETLNTIIKLLEKSSKLFDKDGLNYPSQTAKILKDKYCEWFPEYI